MMKHKMICLENGLCLQRDQLLPHGLKKKLAASTKTFKIVSMHHTPISFGHHHHDWSNKSYGKDLPEKRKRLLGLFRKYGVQIVFCGHEHLYEHNILQYKKNDRGSPRELHVIVTGGGGVPLRRKSDQDTIKKYLDYYEKEGLDIIPEKNEEIYHFCLVSIYSGQVTIDVKEVTGDPEIPLKLIESIVIRDK